VIFSRGRGDARRGAADNGRPGRHARGRRVEEPAELDEQPVVDALAFGPYDVSDAARPTLNRVDLGALQIPAIAGVEIHLRAGPQGEIQQVLLSYGASRLQLGAFAAPRTEGIWDEVRENLRVALAAAGAQPVESEGDYGVELRARVPDENGASHVRHFGVDGPRWFVHGIFVGAAATEPDRAGPLLQALRGLVVDRGSDARPIGEALPLRLPPDAAAALGDAQRTSADRQAT
jgi:hypothetical protein